jgi:ferrous iron transport protein B
VILTDLPSIYSLSPYTLEEVVARNYLLGERPDAILNIVDGTNPERNLYLTTQLMELGIPVVIAINMMDIVRKNGDEIQFEKLSKELGCPVVELSALKNDGTVAAAEAAILAAQTGPKIPKHIFSGEMEHTLAHIEEAALHTLPEEQQRWFAIKLFERDEKARQQLGIDPAILTHIENDIVEMERMMDDDAEAVITNERYDYVTRIVSHCYKRKHNGMTVSERIDSVVTNRFLALPIFAFIMWAVYYISIGTIGDWTVSFMNDTLFGETISPAVENFLVGINVAPWLVSLIVDGIVGGVGSVLGFVPQMLILFCLLSILEDIGYMSRVAFIMDRLFRKFGLSGKSFIPLLVASGCGVPGVMASRTIESQRDRRMTIMTTCFIPCGAKIPIVGMIAGALFGNSPLIATAAYFIGIASVIVSGIMLKKTKPFAGDPAPFVMELPAYHMPLPKNILRTTGDRGWDFIKRAGTVVLAASVIIWVLNSLSFVGGLHYIDGGDEASILNNIGSLIAWIFAPLGFGNWQAAVATILGLVAKEQVVGVFGTLSEMLGEGADLVGDLEAGLSQSAVLIGQEFFGGSKLAGFSFMVFNLLCAPCFAAMGAIKREMNSPKWTWFAIGYMCMFAYSISLIIYQLGMLASGVFTFWTVVAFGILLFLGWMLFRKNPNGRT